MLDNLGLGEFFFLALLALIFFGPERLPQIGARLGRWIRSLTQYSSTFLNEWRDEALAVRDAVQEVKGIRDEIVAARAEIAGTLETARADVSGAVSGARLDVQQQIQRSAQVLPDSTTPAAAKGTGEKVEGESAKPDDGAAITKTQELVDELLAKRTPLTEASPPIAPQPPAALPRATRRPPIGPIQPADIERLRDQVTSLQAELRALRESVAQIRARIQSRTSSEEEDVQRMPPSAEPTPQPDPRTAHIGEPA
jgi:sec-independent protein translocase protein TatB